MDTSNPFTASKTTTSFTPASTDTDQQSTDLIKRWSTAGRPVAIVRPQVSVRADTPIINPDLAHLLLPPRDVIINPETALRFLRAAS
ncbi:hypothetical protein [Endozoicomonas sp. SESOKO1]|uniref:hypothetical protein n=1 Tax=Endozoicomonas sp. SESOKO1 TaxID=2828742 RepID=UPI002147AB5D|nr:hypothetical protein [Endozoicomonas sp. SESOKO1]